MNVLLVYPNIVESPKDIHHGLGIISALLKKNGHKTKLLDSTFGLKNKEIKNTINEFKPDLIAVTTATNDIKKAIEICTEIKKHTNARIIVGGCHPTISPEETINYPCFDYICIGEGEQAILELTNDPKNRKIKNIWFKENNKITKNRIRPLNKDLDSLPFADRELFNYQRYIDSNRGLATFIATRGCPFQCTYCINKTLIDIYKISPKEYVRFRSVKNIIQEIKEVKNNYKIKEIELYDDTFTLNLEYVKEFCEEYKKEVYLQFYVNARVNTATREMFENLKKAGGVRVSMGIEVGNEELRNKVLKRYQTNEQIIQTFKWAREAGLQTYAFNIIGIPFETKEDIQKTIELNKQCQPDYVGISIFNAFPGTEMYDLCAKNNWLKNESSHSYFQSTNVSHPNFTINELKKIRDSFGYQIFKETNLKRAYIDLIDKKFTKYKLYNKIRSLLISKGIKKIIKK